MHHQAAMGVRYRVTDVHKQAQALAHGKAVPVAIGVDGHAVHVVDHQVGRAVGGGAAVEQAHDVGVFQAGQRLALDEKAADHLGVGGALADQFDGHALLELPLAVRQIHFAHAARADLPDQAVASDLCAGQRSVFHSIPEYTPEAGR